MASNRLLPESSVTLPSASGKLTTQDFKKEKDLGRGSFGKVCKVIHRSTNQEYAIKFMEKSKIQKLNMVDQLKNEIDIMQAVQHPNIVKLVTYFEDNSFIYLVMELAEVSCY
jgi:serine/threonine protein kinase